jgi:hypothetical protein
MVNAVPTLYITESLQQVERLYAAQSAFFCGPTNVGLACSVMHRTPGATLNIARRTS